MNFELDERQEERLAEFRDKHPCAILDHSRMPGVNMTGAIGGQYTYLFTPTSIGVVVRVKCACGAEIDLSNYEDW